MHGSHAFAAMLSPLFALRRRRRRSMHCGGGGNPFTLRRSGSDRKSGDRTIMDDRVEKSCWGLAAKAVIAFAGIIFIAWLAGGHEATAVLATAG